jgi:hypothetical protein
VVKSVTRYMYAVFAGELAQLGPGVAEGSRLLLGEAADLSHGDFPACAPPGSFTHDHTPPGMGLTSDTARSRGYVEFAHIVHRSGPWRVT